MDASRRRAGRPVTHRRSATRWRAVASTVAAVALVAGCGGDDEAGDEAAASGSTADEETTTTEGDDPAEQLEEAFDDFAEATEDVECLLPDAVVAELAGEEVTESGFTGGGSGGTAGDLEYQLSYRGCSYHLASGGDIVVGVLVDESGRTAADDFASFAALVGVSDDAVEVPEVAPGAVRNDATIVVPVEGRHLYVDSDTDSPPEDEVAIAVAVATAALDA